MQTPRAAKATPTDFQPHGANKKNSLRQLIFEPKAVIWKVSAAGKTASQSRWAGPVHCFLQIATSHPNGKMIFPKIGVDDIMFRPQLATF